MYESTAERLCSQVSDVFTLIDFYESKDKSYTDKNLIDLFDQLVDCLVKLPPSDSNWSAVDTAILSNFREEAASPSDLRYIVVNLIGILICQLIHNLFPLNPSDDVINFIRIIRFRKHW